MAAEADGDCAFRAAEAFAEDNVFDNYAESCKIEEAVKSSAWGAVSVVEDIRCER